MMPAQKYFINIAADRTSMVAQPAVLLNVDPMFFEPRQWADTRVELGILLARYEHHMRQRRLPRRKRRLIYDGVVNCCGGTHDIVFDVLYNVHKTACALPKDTRRALSHLQTIRVCTDIFAATGPYNHVRFMRLQHKPLPIHAAWEAVSMLCEVAWALRRAVRVFGGRFDAYDYFKLLTFLQPLCAMNLSLQDLEAALREVKAVARWELMAPGVHVEDATPLFKVFVRHLRYAVKRVRRVYVHYKAEGMVCSLLECAPCDVTAA